MFRPPSLRFAVQRYYSQGTSAAIHANKKLIDVLKRHLADESAHPDSNPYKVKAFKSAIDAITAIELPITSLRDLKTVRGIGPGILSRLEEHIPEKDYSLPEKQEPKLRDIKITAADTQDLRVIPGIGPTRAAQLYKAGCKTLHDLNSSAEYQAMLTHTQLLNFKYLPYLDEPVAKEDSEAVLKYVKNNISSGFEVHLAGGCRRESKIHNEMELMLLHPSYNNIPIPTASPNEKRLIRGHIHVPFLSNVIPNSSPTSSLLAKALHPLTQSGFLTDTSKNVNTKWMGFMVLPVKNANGEWEIPLKENSNFRRLSISLVPQRSKGAGLMALTGDGIFTRHVQDKAKRLGLHLNEFGLWKWEDGVWKLICSETEEEIFQNLGMDFVNPTKRNFGLLRAAAA